jgi:hypothetical protein
MGKMFDWPSRRTAWTMSCLSVYGLLARICTSWHSSRRWNKDSGVSHDCSGVQYMVLFARTAWASGFSKVVSN